uniref:Uncharacterized protein n=1 Tax=Triticum urartu TaxID=4572 RepID=A0A8R7P4G9_TRIUA
MKNTPIICVVAVSLGAISLLSGSTDASACAGDPSMSVADACHKTSAWQGQRELELCRQTLRGARDGQRLRRHRREGRPPVVRGHRERRQEAGAGPEDLRGRAGGVPELRGHVRLRARGRCRHGRRAEVMLARGLPALLGGRPRLGGSLHGEAAARGRRRAAAHGLGGQGEDLARFHPGRAFFSKIVV